MSNLKDSVLDNGIFEGVIPGEEEPQNDQDEIQHQQDDSSNSKEETDEQLAPDFFDKVNTDEQQQQQTQYTQLDTCQPEENAICEGDNFYQQSNQAFESEPSMHIYTLPTQESSNQTLNQYNIMNTQSTEVTQLERIHQNEHSTGYTSSNLENTQCLSTSTLCSSQSKAKKPSKKVGEIISEEGQETTKDQTVQKVKKAIAKRDPEIKRKDTRNHFRNFSNQQRVIILKIKDTNHWAIKIASNQFKNELNDLDMDENKFLEEIKTRYKNLLINNIDDFTNHFLITEYLSKNLSQEEKKEKLFRMWFKEFSFEFYSNHIFVYLIKGYKGQQRERVKNYLTLVQEYLMNLTYT